jgi:hypothetical protein
VTTGFLHYNLSTNEVVYNAQGGSGGGGTSALVTASTILATESMIAPTQFYAQELYTNAAYDYTNFCTQFTATGPSAIWCGIAVSATGQYMTAIDNGATYPAGGYIYSSSNFGSTWNQVASQQGWGQVAMNATGQIQIAAIGLGPYGYNGQIYRSTNYGATWSLLAGSFYTFWASLAVSASGQYMVGTDHFSGFNTNGYVYTSSDFGITWTRLTSLPFVVLGPIRVSASGQYQTVTGQGIPLYRSSDYGQTWSSTGTTDRYAGVAVSASGQYQTATSFTFDGGSGSIYVSANYGATWTVYGSTGIIYRQPAISASGRYQVIFVIDSGMYYSSNYGVTWTFIASPNASLYGIAMSAAADYVVVVARDPQQRIYINSLPLLQVATNSLTASNAVMSSLTASNAVIGPLIAANDIVVGGTIFSQNTFNTNVLNLSAFAQSFSLVDNPGTFNYTSAVSATGQYQLVGTTTFLYVSSNFGNTWTQVATDKDWTGVAISGTGNFMYATDSTSSTGNLYRSTDYGLTWAVVPSSPGAGSWVFVAISASGQYVLACGPSYYYLSSNYGASFSQVENYPCLGYVTMSATGQYMMLRGSSTNLLSSNYGATWTAISPASDGYAMAISGTGQYQMAVDTPSVTLYISSDYGATFTASLVGSSFWSCAIDYTGQYQVISQVGINKYYSVDYGVTWTVVANIDPAQSRSVSMSANAQYLLIPNTNGPFYLNRSSVWFPAGISTATANISLLTADSLTVSKQLLVIPEYNLSNSPANFLQNYITSGTSATYASIAVSATGQYQLAGTYVANGILYLSSNYGASFSAVITGYGQWDDATMTYSGNTMYAANTDASTGGLYKSVNYGQTWAVVSGLPAGGYGWVSCSASGKYVLTVGSTNYYLSSDYGTTWAQAGPTSTVGGGETAVSATGQYMVISPNANVYVSQDYGATFTATGRNSISAAISGTGQYILVGYDPNALYLSSNYGATFTNVGGFPPTNYFIKCSIDYTGRYQTVCLLDEPIFYSINYGQTWSQLSGSLPAGTRTVAVSANAQYVVIPGSGNISVFSNAVPVPSLFITNIAQVDQLITSTIATTSVFATTVQIGSTFSSMGTFYALNVNGRMNATVGVFSNGVGLTSDRRIKELITDADLDICYSNVKELPLRRYQYISSFRATKYDGAQIGFIADEVSTLFPKSVMEMETYIDPHFSSIQHLNYDQIFLTHYGATKKLMSVVERQTAQLVEQSTQIAQLLTDNSTLISYIPQLVSTLTG